MRRHPLAAAFGLSALIVAAFALAMLYFEKTPGQALFPGKVGMVEVRGIITSAENTLKLLDQFAEDGSVRAVVLRVDSPGGGVGASQEIYKEIKRLAKIKPVVCSMGGVAASGGYYIAAPCTKIVANPGSITGSIAVISSLPDMQELFQKIGVKIQVIKTGALKGAGQIDRPLTEAERAMLQSAMDDVHQQFVKDVAESRKLPVTQVRALANGGIFTGRRAKELGLVDVLGNYSDAVRLAGRLGGIKGKPKLIWAQNERRSWLSRLFGEEAGAWLRHAVGDFQFSGMMYLYQPSTPAP